MNPLNEDLESRTRPQIIWIIILMTMSDWKIIHMLLILYQLNSDTFCKI